MNEYKYGSIFWDVKSLGIDTKFASVQTLTRVISSVVGFDRIPIYNSEAQFLLYYFIKNGVSWVAFFINKCKGKLILKLKREIEKYD